MNDTKKINCVELKKELQKSLWERSGAKNLVELAAYTNITAKKSDLWQKLTMQKRT